MKNFSDRIGKTTTSTEVQLDSINKDLANGLWNIILLVLVTPLTKKYQVNESYYHSTIESIWFSFFKAPVDEIPFKCSSVAALLKKKFFEGNYLFKYNFIDFLATNKELKINQEEFIDGCNFILKRELSGYRFIDGLLAPIINESEITSIEAALEKSKNKNLIGVNIHLKEAMSKLSDRKSPDYRNSIKESISAIESICQIITGDNKDELGKTLKKLKTILPLHGALEQGFIKIYGYTSDSDGIRHAMMDESSLDQEDALFMLVACSAFVNYLISKSDKMKITLN